jgi:hypothetical protein
MTLTLIFKDSSERLSKSVAVRTPVFALKNSCVDDVFTVESDPEVTFGESRRKNVFASVDVSSPTVIDPPPPSL